MLTCWGCNHPINEARDTVYYDESVTPRKPMCETCYGSDFCKCGRIAFDNGMCIDCLSETEVKAE